MSCCAPFASSAALLSFLGHRAECVTVAAAWSATVVPPATFGLQANCALSSNDSSRWACSTHLSRLEERM